MDRSTADPIKKSPDDLTVARAYRPLRVATPEAVDEILMTNPR